MKTIISRQSAVSSQLLPVVNRQSAVSNFSNFLTFLILTFNFLTLQTINCFSQGTAINTTGNTAVASSILDITSTDKGVLIPRMTTAQRDAITSPATGLWIYNTDCNEFQYYTSTNWISMINSFSNTAPVAVTATNLQQTNLSANWNSVTGASTYYLDVSTASDFSSFVTGYNNLNVGNVVTYSITGLTCNTAYYYRVHAGSSCSAGTSSNIITATTSACFTCGSSTVTDIDGNIYNTVSIGTQCWIKENLKTTKYRNNVAIPNLTTNGTWAADLTGAYCCIDNDCPTNNATYGKLYNWYAVNNANGLCPTGWHVPTHDDWTTLERAVCTSGTCTTDFPYDATTQGWRGTNEGPKLRETGTSHWTGGGGTNTSGFTAVPGGYRSETGPFNFFTEMRMWTATAYDAAEAWWRWLVDYAPEVGRSWAKKASGRTVRCVKD